MVGFSNNKGPEPTVGVKFISAGLAASFADCITFPLDTAKVRLQLQGEGAKTPTAHKFGNQAVHAAKKFKYRGVYGTIRTVAKEEGFRALYNGLVAGLQRQMSFASVRIGLYDSVKTMYFGFFSRGKDSTGQNLFLRVAAGITTGGAAVLCAQPTDVVKVRMQAETRVGAARRYSGAIDAYKTIAKKEGVRGLWKGTGPNVMRNATVNATELVTYDLIKSTILNYQLMTDNMPCHFTSAFITGFITTLTASPIDVIKTRYMNSFEGQYKGVADCANKMYREGGVIAFYKGFMPSFIRLGSWNIVMFVTFEQLKRLFMNMSEAHSSRPAPSGVKLHKL